MKYYFPHILRLQKFLKIQIVNIIFLRIFWANFSSLLDLCKARETLYIDIYFALSIAAQRTYEIGRKNHRRFQGDWPSVPPPLWVKLGGILTKSLLRRLLTWNRSSMHPKRLASISDNSVFKCLYFKRLKKLNCRRLEGFSFFEQKNLFLLSAFILYTIIFNS